MYLYSLLVIFWFSTVHGGTIGEFLNSSGNCNTTDCLDCFMNKDFVYCPLRTDSNCCHNESKFSCENIINSAEQCNSSVSTSPPTPSVDPTTRSTSAEPETTHVTLTSVTISTTDTSPTSPTGRHFDAPSFIGGIVLALGLLAIIYVSFKFYKARTERNYHTL